MDPPAQEYSSLKSFAWLTLQNVRISKVDSHPMLQALMSEFSKYESAIRNLMTMLTRSSNDVVRMIKEIEKNLEQSRNPDNASPRGKTGRASKDKARTVRSIFELAVIDAVQFATVPDVGGKDVGEAVDWLAEIPFMIKSLPVAKEWMKSTNHVAIQMRDFEQAFDAHKKKQNAKRAQRLGSMPNVSQECRDAVLQALPLMPIDMRSIPTDTTAGCSLNREMQMFEFGIKQGFEMGPLVRNLLCQLCVCV